MPNQLFSEATTTLLMPVCTQSWTANNGAGLRNNTGSVASGTERFTGLAPGHWTHRGHYSVLRIYLCYLHEKRDSLKIMLRYRQSVICLQTISQLRQKPDRAMIIYLRYGPGQHLSAI